MPYDNRHRDDVGACGIYQRQRRAIHWCFLFEVKRNTYFAKLPKTAKLKNI